MSTMVFLKLFKVIQDKIFLVPSYLSFLFVFALNSPPSDEDTCPCALVMEYRDSQTTVASSF